MSDHLVVAGRGRVIADTSVKNLIAAGSGDRVRLRTSARAEAVAATASDLLVISNLSSERTVAVLTAAHVPFSKAGRVLAAKAVVIAAVTVAAGLVSATVVVTLGQRVLQPPPS